MAELAPVGPISLACTQLRTLLSNLDTWQTWTRTDNADDAATFVSVGEHGVELISASIAANVLTLKLARPLPLSAGQNVVLIGSQIGQQGYKFSGQRTVLAVGDEQQYPWTWADTGEPIINSDTGLPWTYASGEYDTLTIAVVADDLAEVQLNDAVLYPSGWPFICICEGENALSSKSIGTGGVFTAHGVLEVLIDARLPGAYRNDAKNAGMYARNQLGALLTDLMSVQGQSDYLAINTADISSGPLFLPVEASSDNGRQFERWQAVLKLAFGMEG